MMPLQLTGPAAAVGHQLFWLSPPCQSGCVYQELPVGQETHQCQETFITFSSLFAKSTPWWLLLPGGRGHSSGGFQFAVSLNLLAQRWFPVTVAECVWAGLQLTVTMLLCRVETGSKRPPAEGHRAQRHALHCVNTGRTACACAKRAFRSAA